MVAIALLAPVPLEHLKDGIGICQKEGKLAFGSRAWDTFRELDELRNSNPVPVLIYASMSQVDGPATITWQAQSGTPAGGPSSSLRKWPTVAIRNNS